MPRITASALAAAAALLGTLPAEGASAQSCREPDADPLRTPVGENRTSFDLTVENVRSSSGNIVVTVYGDDPKRWLEHEGSLYIYTVPASASTVRTCLVLPGFRKYAIAVYHDRNGNGRIDRSKLLGLPTEDAGLSNNPSLVQMVWPQLGPSLIDVKRAGMSTTIRLRRPPG
jgi:uncharacterized protein (DUF2141 family)